MSAAHVPLHVRTTWAAERAELAATRGNVARAKGQQRAHVIVAGVDLGDVQSPIMQRQLYVALTRATVGANLLHLVDTTPSGIAEEAP